MRLPSGGIVSLPASLSGTYPADDPDEAGRLFPRGRSAAARTCRATPSKRYLCRRRRKKRAGRSEARRTGMSSAAGGFFRVEAGKIDETEREPEEAHPTDAAKTGGKGQSGCVQEDPGNGSEKPLARRGGAACRTNCPVAEMGKEEKRAEAHQDRACRPSLAAFPGHLRLLAPSADRHVRILGVIISAGPTGGNFFCLPQGGTGPAGKENFFPVRAFSIGTALHVKPYGLTFSAKKTRCYAHIGPGGVVLPPHVLPFSKEKRSIRPYRAYFFPRNYSRMRREGHGRQGAFLVCIRRHPGSV